MSAPAERMPTYPSRTPLGDVSKNRPSQRRRQTQLTAEQRRLFLRGVELIGNATLVAEFNGATIQAFARLRRREPSFGAAWDAALFRYLDRAYAAEPGAWAEWSNAAPWNGALLKGLRDPRQRQHRARLEQFLRERGEIGSLSRAEMRYRVAVLAGRGRFPGLGVQQVVDSDRGPFYFPGDVQW